jgi:opine dehydrogenase
MIIPAQLLLLHTSLQLQLQLLCCIFWKNNASAFNIGLTAANSSARRRPTNSGSSLFVSSNFHNRRTSVSPTIAVAQTMRRRRRRLHTNNAIVKHNKAFDLFGACRHSYCCCAHTTTADMNDEIASTSNYSSLSFKVGIVGAGAVAYGTASLLSSLNHDAMLWSPSSSSSSTDSNTRTLQSTGAISHSFTVRTTTSPRQLIISNDGIILLALPANGHKTVMETLSPYIIDHLLSSNSNVMNDNDNGVNKYSNDNDGIAVMHIIISSHASLGAVYFLQVLRNECHRRVAMQMQPARQCGVNDNNIDDTATMKLQVVDTIMKRIKITAWGTTVITARKVSNTIVHIPSVRTVVDYCTVPTSPPPSSTTTTTTTTITTSSIDSTTPSVTTKIKTTTKQELLMNDDGYNLCTILFSSQQTKIQFQKRAGGLLAITLSNLNPQNHLGIVLGNMSRMDIAPVPPPPDVYTTTKSTIHENDDKTTPSSPPWYQCVNVTPNIGRLMEALDVERLAIAQALDINVRTIHEHYSWSFGIPMKTPINNGGDDESTSTISEETTATTATMRDLSISEMNQQMHYYLHNDVLGPATPNTRYVIEDVPYGLVTTVLLGRLVGKIALLHESGIHILSAMYGQDFMIENDLLCGLGLLSPPTKTEGTVEKNVPSLESWKRMAYSGSFSEQ